MNKQFLDRSKVMELTLCALFVALTAIGAFIKIPAPLAPISLQVLFVIMAGIILGPRLGFISQIAYVGLGLLGLPIFALGGGPTYIFQPTFGFLLGFAAAAFVIGEIVSRTKPATLVSLIFASLAGLLTIYLIALPYMYYMMHAYLGMEIHLTAIVWSACVIFLPGDLIKLIIASYLSLKIKKALKI